MPPITPKASRREDKEKGGILIVEKERGGGFVLNKPGEQGVTLMPPDREKSFSLPGGIKGKKRDASVDLPRFAEKERRR